MPSVPKRVRAAAARKRLAAARRLDALANITRDDVEREIRARVGGNTRAASAHDKAAVIKKGETPIDTFGLHPILGFAPAVLAALAFAAIPFGQWPIPYALFIFTASWVRSWVGGRPADTQLRRLGRRLLVVAAAHAALVLAIYAGLHTLGLGWSTSLALGGIAAIHALLLYLEWREDRLILTQTQATHRIGFLNKDDEDVEYSKISTTKVTEKLWMRLIKGGLVVLDSDADKESLIAEFGLVYDPHYVRGRMLRAKKEAARKGYATGPLGTVPDDNGNAA